MHISVCFEAKICINVRVWWVQSKTLIIALVMCRCAKLTRALPKGLKFGKEWNKICTLKSTSSGPFRDKMVLVTPGEGGSVPGVPVGLSLRKLAPQRGRSFELSKSSSLLYAAVSFGNQAHWNNEAKRNGLKQQASLSSQQSRAKVLLLLPVMKSHDFVCPAVSAFWPTRESF